MTSSKPGTGRLKVRPATLRDARTIADVHATALREALKPRFGDLVQSLPGVEKRLGVWREAIEYSEPQVIVAIDEDKLAGFIGFDRSRDKGTPPTMGELWAWYVQPTRWGRGIGRALWDSAREGLVEEGCTHVSLWIPTPCERCQRVAAAAGFEPESHSARVVKGGPMELEEVRWRRSLN